MSCQISIDDRERELLLNMLHEQQRELATESHRADRYEVRKILEQRLETVDRLVDRLEGATQPTN
jgi:hypothetical protein